MAANRSLMAGRNVRLFLTGLGTVAIMMGTIEYWYRLQGLRKDRPNCGSGSPRW